MTKYIIKYLINMIVKVLSLLIPRTRKIVIVAGWFGYRFADNSKAMYLYLFQNKDKLGLHKVIFITKDPEIFEDLSSQGYSVVMSGTLASAWYHLRGKIHILDQGPKDLDRIFSVRAKKINLWHGFALKKVNYMMEKGNKTLEEIIEINEKAISIGEWNDAYFLAQSREQGEQLQWMFGLREERLIYGIYPRVIYMLGGISKFYMNYEEEFIIKLIDLREKNKKVILYLPTFRDINIYNDQCIDTILELEDFLIQNDLYIITKLHFAAGVSEQKYNKIDNIINLPASSDVYNFIEFADIMITDYSSVYFDFMLLNRPIVFYPFDIDYYENEDRGFVYDYDSFIPGAKASNVQELETIIVKILQSQKQYMEKYNDIYNWERELVYEDRKPSIDELNKLWERIVL